LIALRRTDSHRLGFALQIGTVRCAGRFLEDPIDVPWPAVDYLAEQLGIADPSCIKRYVDRIKTAYEHAWEIRDAYGYHQFEEPAWGKRFRTFLHGRRGRRAADRAPIRASATRVPGSSLDPERWARCPCTCSASPAWSSPRKGKPSAGRPHRRTRTRLPQTRTGSEGRISHLKHGYGWNRTHLDGIGGGRAWCEHGVFAHNLVKIGALTA
jgi:hypothetical protein